MLELELTGAAAVLTDWAPKGDVDDPFVVLKISCDLGADCLAFFAPDLKERMVLLAAIEDLVGGDTLKVRDNGEIYPMCRSEKMAGALLKLDFGLGKAMDYPEAEVGKFEITPWDGGKVTLDFEAKIRPDEGQVGRLYYLRKRPITITLEPAEPPKMAEAA